MPAALQGFDWEGLYPFPHLTLPAIRYDASNFFMLELRPNGSFRWGVPACVGCVRGVAGSAWRHRCQRLGQLEAGALICWRSHCRTAPGPSAVCVLPVQ